MLKFWLLLAISIIHHSAVLGQGDNPRIGRRSCKSLKLDNGVVRGNGRTLRFECSRGYQRIGESLTQCRRGQWSNDVPYCIKSGCDHIENPANGLVTYFHDKAQVLLSCLPNYELAGSQISYCNGSHWDRSLGTCRETGNPSALSCDFEAENLCGWQHDDDRDFDFARTSGFNRKSVQLHTGPYADHSVGRPYEGHFMIVRPNRDTTFKSTHLISPIYDRSFGIGGCFEVFINRNSRYDGHWRIYIKPINVSVDDVMFQDDYDFQSQSKYIIFSDINDTNLENKWEKLQIPLKNYGVDFQIIIEAVTGYSAISFFAVDDVSLLSAEECSKNEEFEATTSSSDVTEDDDFVVDVQSCVNRCFEKPILNKTEWVVNHVRQCQCYDGCDDDDTCCPDFLNVCYTNLTNVTQIENPTTPEFNLTSTTEIISTTIPTTISTTIKTTTSTTTIPTTSTSTSIKPTTTTSTTQRTTTSTAKPTTKKQIIIPVTRARRSTTTTSTTTTTTVTPTTTTTTTTPQTTTTVTPTTPTTTKTTTPLTTTTTTKPKSATESDYLEIPQLANDDMEAPEIATEPNILTNKSESGILIPIANAVLIGIGAVTISLVVIIFAIKQYKKSTDPRNYKNNQSKGCKNASGEFSEVRYLTSDEVLDFTMASPETISNRSNLSVL